MSWAVGYDDYWERDIGYGVPAYCDEPGCMEKIDRGLSYVCGGEPYGGDEGCGLFFCPAHRGLTDEDTHCQHEDYQPTPDHPEWTEHKATHPSWAEWRQQTGLFAGNSVE
jgi:hypothetical protein